MAITRRQFLKRTGAVAAGSLLGPGLLGNPFIRKVLADEIGDRYFIVIYLDGGNDGLNTVTPYSNGGGTLRDDYEAARTSIRLTPTQLDATKIGNDPNTGGQLALHPGFTGLKALWDLNKLAVIQGCGYPDYNLSHEQSRSIWQSADPLGLGLSGGWVGRYLAANYGGSDIPAVNISDSIVGEFKQGTTSVITLERLADFGFPYDYDYGDDTAAKRTAFLALCDQAHASAQSTVQYIGDSGKATLLSSESYPGLDSDYVTDRPSFNASYDAVGRSLSDDLREVAKVIYGVSRGVPNVNARIFQVSNGGYDTHSDQGGAETDGQQYGLHKEVGDSVKVFYDDLVGMGVADKVCIVTWSEFSRRIPQNDSGTDHGSQGPMFVIGGGVTGGVYGNHPNIADLALDSEGNTVYTQSANGFRSTDFRDVYGTILKHWLGMTAPQLSALLPADAGPSQSYWTAPNFDLGFF
jgi:uncharacterized protein (DUF1501 family)